MTFQRWRMGRIWKNKGIQAAIEDVITKDFAKFGITENIWKNKTEPIIN